MVLQRALAGEPGHLLAPRPDSRPAATRRRRPCRACRPAMTSSWSIGHPHADDDEVDLRVRRHVAEAVKRPLGTERRGRSLGGVLMRGAHRLQLIVGQCLQGGNVGIRPPSRCRPGVTVAPTIPTRILSGHPSLQILYEAGPSPRCDAVGGLVQIGHIGVRGQQWRFREPPQGCGPHGAAVSSLTSWDRLRTELRGEALDEILVREDRRQCARRSASLEPPEMDELIDVPVSAWK